MNFLIKKAVPFLGLVLISSVSFAQEQLTNKEIINLQTAKVSQDVILAKISASKSSFDLTAQGLIELDAAKISDRVIKAMFVASPPQAILHNQEVIKIAQSEVSTAILKEAIKQSPHQFEVSADALIALKNAKVPDSVVKEMLLNPAQGIMPTNENKGASPIPPKTTTPAPQNTTSNNVVNTVAQSSIIVTNAYEEVKNLKRIAEISASAKRAFGSQSKLRIEAIENLKKEAAAKGATHVLIQAENFAPTPLNTVSISGVAYKK